ncbi:MAG: RNA pseudouridine synthase [Candidatus Pacebacteria bacterium]|nr:RNA pseudouridine synthase [Candidatus Paceibacterota bacterium]
MKIKVLYEDNHIIAVYKESGILTQGDNSRKPSLLSETKKYLKKKYNKTGNVFLGLVHRLDMPVSGIVLFAKTTKAASRLSQEFRNHKVEKVYHAVVIGKPEKKSGVLISYIEKDKDRNKVKVFNTLKPKSKRAELYYEIIKSNNKYSLLKIWIKTGKPHQIRAQLSFLGCPILGDVKYGAYNPLDDKSIMLCANEISFKLTTQDKIKKISVPLPRAFKLT